jgi:hypothetical protein
MEVFAGCVECFTHDLCCVVVKDPGEASLFDKSYDRGHIENLPLSAPQALRQINPP